jgi:hypothetical protein
MEEMPGDQIVQRLTRLERGLRRWRALGAVAWLLLAAGLALNTTLLLKAMSASDAEVGGPGDNEEPPWVSEQDEVRSHAFVLVDSDGRPRAALAFRPDGTPALAFTDGDGRLIWTAPSDRGGEPR